MFRRSVTFAVLLSALPALADDPEQFFENRIRPVLVTKCFKCHGSQAVSGELRVDSRDALLKGGDTGAAIVPGEPDASLLIQAIAKGGDYEMPPDDPLPPGVVDDFRTWIRSGAVWPKLLSGATSDPAFTAQRHWAFQPVQRPAIPEVRHPEQAVGAIDRFVLARLDAADLEPSPSADRATLIRRLKLDLLGLPPTFDEVQAFVADDSREGWAQLVDRYLASPQYGERWGRHWLDVARYADTKGYVFQEDRKYPFAWTYRDWVVRSLNDDLPYDQFLIRQIAADGLVKDGLSDQELAAMGFLTLGRRFLNNQHDIIDDRIDVVTRGTMGLTVTCARCHDHKYDPIPQADYYSLYGVFASSEENKDAQHAMPLFDKEKPFDPYVFLRGQAGNHGPRVPRQFLEVVAGTERRPFEHGSGRLELARAIADPHNPLTARVMVNRVWKLHFHSPLVTTPSDFGLRCDPPTHPELLDWLAAEFVDSGWSLKSLHRQILLSATWRQSSMDRPDARAVDSENRLLWRMNRGRLELESMRDSVLAVAGELDLTVGGQSVDITQNPAPRRRTIYGSIDRQNLPALFRTFDFATPDQHSPGRFETSVPQQTLYLRNSPFLAAEARRVEETLTGEGPAARVQTLFRRVLCRDPDAAEISDALRFIESADVSPSTGGGSVWSCGYGRFNPETGRLDSFTPLPHFDGKTWQGGSVLPDLKLGWVSLRADSGHPGDPDHAAVRRWTAPSSMTVRISGELSHASEHGNGVDAIISTSGKGLIQRWTVTHGRERTATGPFHVDAGESVDFIVDCRGDVSFDSFQWTPEVRETGNRQSRWNAAAQFAGPAPAALNPWALLAQVLLLSNEFQFVD